MSTPLPRSDVVLYEIVVRKMLLKGRLTIILALFLILGQARAAVFRVAVASNFADAMKVISHRFEAQTGHSVMLVSGSTGKHYAQIKNGAPFEVFFAADVKRPMLLEEEGVALRGSRFTYAVGRVVLWSPEPGYVDTAGKVLEQADFRHLAVANPKLAPYGMAAREVMAGRGLWERLRDRIVRGENIGQAIQYVKSGSAELGFVALSQVRRPGHSPEGSCWDIPHSLYTPIEQQAVLLKDHAAARAFLEFVKTEEAREIIRGYGYDTP